jgi:hypothetical protein
MSSSAEDHTAGHAENHAERHYEVRLRASTERASQIGRIVAAHLRHWKLAAHMGPVSDGIAELVANVHRHVGEHSPCTVELHWMGRHLTASVHDEEPRMPRLLATGGGLARIAAQSDSWGSCPLDGGGKAVWFTRGAGILPTPLAVPAPPAARLADGLDRDGAGERAAA